EEGPHGFSVEVILQRLPGRRGVREELAVGGREVERQKRRARISLLAARDLFLVGHVTVQADPQKSAKAALAGLVRTQEVLLERAREKTLGQVLPLFVVGLPLDAQVFVDRLPVRVDEKPEGALLLWSVVRACREDGRAPCRRESTGRSADRRVIVHLDGRYASCDRGSCARHL